MSLYNMLFGVNEKSDLLLAVIGMKKSDVERFRDIFLSNDGKQVAVYTRTGGGNREDYPQMVMRHLPGWQKSIDDDFDSTYCTDYINVPEEFANEVLLLDKIFEVGLRPEFAKHLGKTLFRTPTEGDLYERKYEAERLRIKNLEGTLANGHTFVPYSQAAMELALMLAEQNGGVLISCWGIAPLKLKVETNVRWTPNSPLSRVKITPEWEVDTEFWELCKTLFSEKYPLSIAKIEEWIERQN